MKKFLKPLSLLVILGLVACSGKSISRTEAIEILKSIEEKEKSDEIEAASVWRLEQKGEETVKEKATNQAKTTKDDVLIAVDKDAKKAYLKTYGSSTEVSASSDLYEQWIYLNDEKFYVLTNDNNEKTYYTIDARQDVGGKFNTIISMYETAARAITIFYTANIAKTILVNLDATAATSRVISESYKTKGDGNVSIDISRVPKATLGLLSGKIDIHYTFDNYSFTTYNLASELTTEVDVKNAKNNIEVIYGKANISLPKLNDFIFRDLDNPQ